MSTPKTNQNRLWGSVMEPSRIGCTDKDGIGLSELTKAKGRGRDVFIKWHCAAGDQIPANKIGNTFARRSSRREGSVRLLVGSRRPMGGKLNEVYRVMYDRKIGRRLKGKRYRDGGS